MPTLVFIIMYIAGVLLAFTGNSVFPSVRLPVLIKVFLFMKIGRGKIFIHIIVFQIINLLAYVTTVYFVAAGSAYDVVLIYNIYVKVSFALLAVILAVSAIDAHLVENGMNGRNRHEDN